MAQIGPAEGYKEEEETTDDEDLDAVSSTKIGLGIGTTDRYIENIIGVPSTNDSNTDDELVDIESPKDVRKGGRKAGKKIEWSADEDDAYEKFKDRASIKRKKKANTKKSPAAKLKNAVVGRVADNMGEEKERIWADAPDYDLLEDSLPDYVLARRKDFDQNRQKLQKAGLRLPPDYNDIDFSDDERLAELEERPQFSESIRPSQKYKDVELPHSLGLIPAPIAQYLRDYQIDGVSFLHELFVYQKGGILGDDMGLGKTVQVAAFLAAAFGKTGDERDAKRMRKMRRAKNAPWYPQVLVICPGSLIQNWKQELKRWGWWYVDAFHGDSKDATLSAAISGRLEIVITTYQTYKMYRSKLNLIDWDCVVADEFHQLKERTSETTKAMNEVNALCRIGLTGTAIQNKYEELWTLLNWTNPGRFGPVSTWKSIISDPLRLGQSHNATLYQLSRARTIAKKLVENLLPQFFLRRMKSLIAHQLPKKSDKVVFCPLTDVQQQAYERFLGSPYVELVKCSAEPCDCNSGKKRGWCCYAYLPDGETKWQVLVFPLIATLSKLSNHLALLIPASNDPHDKQQRALDFLIDIVPERWQELYKNRDSLVHLSNPEFCGKWKILKKLLRYWHGNGDKVLVFSHSVKLLKILHQLFNNTSYNVNFLDGSMSYEDRQKEVDDFNSDPGQFVFLISTKAGGVGLNITSANKVVIMDPNWNPSYDLQAQDRAYRIGQVRDVEVFRLVSAGTIEEIVYARQIYKQQQANIGYNASMERRYFKGVQNQKGQKGEIFGLQNLLTYHADDVVLRDIVNKTNVAEAKAGINMVEIDMTQPDENNPFAVDDENEDAAMSQLASLIEGGDSPATKMKPKPKTDAVQAILASAGVEYTHENSEVVGSSKIEARLSRRAEETGNEIGVGDEVLFAESQSQDHASDQRGGMVNYIYHPPADVTFRQFCTMAKTFGFENATDFALIVEGWTQEQRRNCLDAFYAKRKERLGEMAARAAGFGEDTGMEEDADVERNDGVKGAAVYEHGKRDEVPEESDTDDLDA